MQTERIWSRDLHQRASHHTLLSADAILTLERENRLVRLDPLTGDALWEARVRNSWGWLARNEARAFYLNQHDWLQCFDLDTGRTLWERGLDGGRGIYGYLVAAHGHLLTGGWRGYTHLRCVDPASGKDRWQYAERRDVALPVYGSWGIALACMAPHPGTVTLLDADTGLPTVQLALPPGGRMGDFGSSLQAYEDGLLFTGYGSIYRMAPGIEETWERIGAVANDIATITPTLTRSRLVLKDVVHNVIAFDLTSGYSRWAIRLEHHPNDVLPAASLPRLGTVVGTSQGRLVVIDDAGEALGAVSVGKRLTTGIGGLTDRTIVFGSGGRISSYAVSAGSA